MHNTLDRREMGIQGDLLSLENPLFHSSSGCAAILTHSIDIPVTASRFSQKPYSSNWCGTVTGSEWKENCTNL